MCKLNFFCSIIFAVILIMRPFFLAAQPVNEGKTKSEVKVDVKGAVSIMDDVISKSEKVLSIEEEYFLGRSVAASILSVYEPYTKNEALTQYLNLICQALVINSPMPAAYNGYHVMILDTDEYNAFATTGGHIFITRGFIEAAASEDALAAIIAHELAHIMLKHSMTIIDFIKFEDELFAAASRAESSSGIARNNDINYDAYYKSVINFSDIMLNTGFSKPQEFEADKNALVLLALTGYNPRGLLDILNILNSNILNKTQRGQVGGINKTHPSPADRISNLEKELPRFARFENTNPARINRFKNK